jgi:peptide/nickel transport system substrate-binding protein
MSKTNKLMVAILVFALLAAAGILAIVKYSNFSEKETSKNAVKEAEKVARDRLVIGVRSFMFEDKYLSQSGSGDSITFFSHIFDPLVSFDKDRRLLPGSGLALSWSNPNNLTWRFRLNPKATFSDGTPVKATDVKFTYDIILKNNFFVAASLPGIKEVKVIDDKTVDFITETPNPTLVNKLANLLIISEANYTATGQATIGSGPYKLTDFKDETIRTLVANENYWREKPLIKEVVYKVVKPIGEEKSDTAKIKALLNKEIDIASIAGEQEDMKLIGNKLKYKTQLDSGVYFLSLNSIKDSALKNLKVRKAISLAIDTQELSPFALNGSVKISQIVTNSIFGYNPTLQAVNSNTAEAQALLVEAGFANGLELPILGMKGDPAIEVLVQQLAKINIKLTPEYLEPNDFFGKIAKGESTMAGIYFTADSGDSSEVLESLFHTPNQTMGSSNLGYSNKQVDDLIEKAASTMDMKTRQLYLKDAIKIITEDVAYVPLFVGGYTYAYAKDLFWQPRADGQIKAWELAGLR